ncbi:MAG: helix-turn-helix transcriptional regulator, partial [Treponema sp.]|nr:helix-turn-helix transcriptional regulator [Treponema sp.]
MQNEESVTLEKILEVARAEFLEKGFRGASLREVVKKAGVTTGAFYGYFKSKEELFDALVKKHADHIKGIYDEILSEFEKIPLEQQIASMDNYSSL